MLDIGYSRRVSAPPPPPRPPISFPPAEYHQRIRRLAAKLRALRLDGAIIASPLSCSYYTGFHSSNALLLITPGDTPRFLTDFRYLPAAKRRLPFLHCHELKRAATPSLLAKHTATWQRAALEHTLPHAQFLALQNPLDHINHWTDLTPLISAQRALKSPCEIRALRHAVALNDLLLQRLVAALPSCHTEWDARLLIRRHADLLGQGEAFDAIPAFGKNAAECHHTPDATPLARGKALLFDLGLICDHYCADLTRTLCLGAPSKTLAHIHAIVLRANQTAARKIRPGMTGADADAIARDIIDKAGYAKSFGHSLGHGLGLEVHESPTLSPTSTDILRPGHVVTIEPGIYLPGLTGVRIEDVALITKDGCEILSHFPRDLRLP